MCDDYTYAPQTHTTTLCNLFRIKKNFFFFLHRKNFTKLHATIRQTSNLSERKKEKRNIKLNRRKQQKKSGGSNRNPSLLLFLLCRQIDGKTFRFDNKQNRRREKKISIFNVDLICLFVLRVYIQE